MPEVGVELEKFNPLDASWRWNDELPRSGFRNFQSGRKLATRDGYSLGPWHPWNIPRDHARSAALSINATVSLFSQACRRVAVVIAASQCRLDVFP